MGCDDSRRLNGMSDVMRLLCDGVMLKKKYFFVIDGWYNRSVVTACLTVDEQKTAGPIRR